MFSAFPLAGAPFAGIPQSSISFAVSGVSATGALGEVKTGISVQPDALTAQVLLGNAVAKANADALITGIGAVSTLGNVTVYLQKIVDVNSVSAVVSLGTITPSSNNIIDITGFGLTASLGEENSQGNATITLTGFVGTVALGTVDSTAEVVVYLTGVSATGFVNYPLVWGIIDTSQIPNWTPIAA
jgi:hypothetical protein